MWLWVHLHRESQLVSSAKVVAAQQQSLDSLAKVVLVNYVALDYLLAEQGGICAIRNVTCCIWINASGEVEIQLYNNRVRAHWLRQTLANDPWLFALHTWIPSGFGSWFRTIKQTGFLMLFLILLCVIIFNSFYLLPVKLCRSGLLSRVMLTVHFKMISNAYNLDKI